MLLCTLVPSPAQVFINIKLDRAWAQDYYIIDNTYRRYVLSMITSLITDIIVLYQLAQARPHNVLHFLVLGSGMSRDVPGCPMATWDNSDLGLAGWCKVVGCLRMSRVVPWQLGTTRTWDWQGGVR